MVQIKALAAAHSLGQNWIPCNPAVRDLVLTKLKRGFYNADKKPLIKDLTTDIGLFSHCLRSIFQHFASTGEAHKTLPFDLCSLLEATPVAVLKDSLEKKPSDISVHSFENPPENAGLCLHSTLISAAASESLSEKACFPSAAGFTTAVLRQIGLLLIAWNYPHVFRLACKASRNCGSLDHALLKHLGYSPRMLSVVLAREWELSSEFRYAIGDEEALFDASDSHSMKLQRAADILKKSCEVSELLAQANFPDLYPEGKKSWANTRQKIQAVLGNEALSSIHQKLGEYAAEYLNSNQKAFETLLTLPVDFSSVTPETQAISAPVLSSATPEVEVSPELRAVLAHLYASLDPAHPRKEDVLLFAEELVPKAGFSGGCIYMFDFENSELVPRYRFGTCSLANERVKTSALGPTIHPVAEAFRSPRAVIEHNPWHERDLGFVTQTFGNIQRVGVLYLQIGPPLGDDHIETISKIFDLLRKALMDCLGVK